MTATQSPALTIVKSATPTSVATVGQTVTYHVHGHEHGERGPDRRARDRYADSRRRVRLTSGPTCQSLATPTGTCSGASTSLAPGQSATFTATYTVTQADLDHGSINDSATATGTPPSGPPMTSPPSTATVTATQSPALSIVKSATPTSVATVGQTVTYHFTVTNTGNVDLTTVHVTDTQDAPAGASDVGADVPVVGDSGGYVLGYVDVARAGPVGDVHRDLHGDAGRSGSWVDQRFGDRDRDAAVRDA